MFILFTAFAVAITNTALFVFVLNLKDSPIVKNKELNLKIIIVALLGFVFGIWNLFSYVLLSNLFFR